MTSTGRADEEDVVRCRLPVVENDKVIGELSRRDLLHVPLRLQAVRHN